MSSNHLDRDFAKMEAIAYMCRRTTPKKAKLIIRHLLERCTELERANKSFGETFDGMGNHLVDFVERTLVARQQQELESGPRGEIDV